ncbi:MAG: DUF6377 domain-containing protein [Bacteroidales bacterium]|nr:DUF6377 domain-containing protein [Bacteroidales bacterium]
MAWKSTIGSLLSLLLILSGCTPKYLQDELRVLEKELTQGDIYSIRVEKQNQRLKELLAQAPSDSLKWEYADSLCAAYKHLDLDSTDKYTVIAESHAVSEVQKLRSLFHTIYSLSFRGLQNIAEQKYLQIDTAGLSVKDRVAYLDLGIDLFKNNHSELINLSDIRAGLFKIDTVSFSGRKNYANICRENEDIQKAMDIFKGCLGRFNDQHEIISIYYNIAMLYGELGDLNQKEYWLAKTAVEDIRISNKDYQSLYQLALMRLDDKDFSRAASYIQIHYSDISSSRFYPRMQTSGIAEQRISQEYIKSQIKMKWIQSIGLALLSILVIIVLILFQNNRKKADKLEKTSEQLAQSNSQLSISNKIKEVYVFRYMMLSLRYMKQAQQDKKDYKRILRDKGRDELLQVLKQIDRDYSSEKEFYNFFDDAFLHIFPDFVCEVNQLLKPSDRFDESSHTLTTEVRILAVIRLGITSSPDISKFLGCALPTVYTYRAKLRNAALCGKDEFEARVAQLGL